MYELEATEYDVARALFQTMDIHLAVRAALEHKVPARIYVDDPDQPHSALAWIQHRFFLTGTENNAEFNSALQRFILETVYAQGLAARQEVFALYYAPDSWADPLENILQGKQPIKAARQFYRFKESRQDWRALLPGDFTLKFLDREFLENDYLNLDALRDEMCSERPSVEDFLAQSFGVCLLHGNILAGWCLSEYNNADRCEIGIETLEPYQRRGLATAMTGALVEHACAHGITNIGWHCFADNIPSIATALKAGFEFVKEYPAFILGLTRLPVSLPTETSNDLRDGRGAHGTSLPPPSSK